MKILKLKLSFLLIRPRFSQLIKRQSCHHIETSQLICRANQFTGFCMMATLAFNALKNLIVHYDKSIDPFHTADLFLYPLETSDDQVFSNVFRGYRKRAVASNELKWLA